MTATMKEAPARKAHELADSAGETARIGAAALKNGEPRSPLRIVHVVSSLMVGGMEQFVLRIAAAQAQRGDEVSILAIRGGPLKQEAEKIGVKVHELRNSNKVARALDGLAVLRRTRPQIAHAHNPTSLHYALLGKTVAKARVVMTDHGQGFGSRRVPDDKEWYRTDAVIAVSDAVAGRRNIPAIATKLQVIRNGVHCSRPRRSREEVRAEMALGDAVVGAIVARVDGFKGHEPLIRAWAEVQKQHAGGKRPVLLVVGDGAKRVEMQELALELKLGEDEIRFLGFRNDAPDLLGASDLFILPSMTEGLPLSVLEAMSHGLAVIATPVGGVPEVVVDGETGILVPEGDNAALAAKIGLLIEDTELRQRMGRAGLERVEQHFSFDVMVDRYEQLYRSLISSTGTRGASGK